MPCIRNDKWFIINPRTFAEITRQIWLIYGWHAKSFPFDPIWKNIYNARLWILISGSTKKLKKIKLLQKIVLNLFHWKLKKILTCNWFCYRINRIYLDEIFITLYEFSYRERSKVKLLYRCNFLWVNQMNNWIN